MTKTDRNGVKILDDVYILDISKNNNEVNLDEMMLASAILLIDEDTIVNKDDDFKMRAA